MVPIFFKWLHDCSKWLNGSKWDNLVLIGPNDFQWVHMCPNLSNWVNIGLNRFKLIQIGLNRSK